MKRVNPQRIKIHRNYTVKEIARRLGVDKQTVLRWIKQGLPTIDARRPLLILGSDLKKFIEQRRKARRQTCPLGHLFCVRCRTPKVPAGNMVDWLPTRAGSGLLQGICPSCGILIHRGVTAARLEAVTHGLEVTLPRAQRGLRDTSPASVDVHFGREAQTHAEA